MAWPKVKTGPTRGQDRSRNKGNGRIRAKRSDTGKKRK
jgi:hypothetical protein